MSKLYSRQRQLVSDLIARMAEPNRRPLHVAVEVNKSKNFGRETTQRSRSFLFASLAAVVARIFNRDRIRFYENGVVSLNLPISPQTLGGRATRTTHPQVLNGFEKLFSLVFDRPFTVENPFLWKTKADVLREIKAAGVSRLCARTSSCTHTRAQTKCHTHCGLCSQCVDRRLSALAADFCNDEDPREMYASDVVVGPRSGPDLTMIERYVGVALEIDRMNSPTAFVTRFPEAARVFRHLGTTPEKAAESVFDLYRRHANDVCQTLAKIVSAESQTVVRKCYPPNCLLSIAVGRNIAKQVMGETPPAGDHKPCDNGSPSVDRDTFSIKLGKLDCPLGNTIEFALFERLSLRPGTYIPNHKLATEVWDNDRTEKNTIQRTVSNLRRRLKDAGMDSIRIDGSNKDHYAVKFHA